MCDEISSNELINWFQNEETNVDLMQQKVQFSNLY